MELLISLLQKSFSQNTQMLNSLAKKFEGEDVFFRPYQLVNHLAWQIGHLTFVRNTIIKIIQKDMILNLLPLEKENFMPGTPLPNNQAFPSIEEMLKAFDERGQTITVLLENIDSEKWHSESPFKIPIGNTIGEQIWGFLAHENRHLGEICYLKNIMVRNKENTQN
ncbi:MAG: DinB family protein [Pseudarcicella sp.]|nr:DinB family protein [Pseudarcicella sp.]MBP6410581.1 DinB family protein [Pseudarcicella sp.]